jgi:LuxR family maltose regulon positive regulatory protein
VSERQRISATNSDTLLQARLHIPGAQPSHTSRPRLLALLDGARHARLTLVAAPAGSGKTTLAGAWARQYAEQAAWLELEPADNNPARFWSYVLHALHQRRPAIVAPLLTAFRSPQPPPLEATLAELLNGLAASDDDLLLILDDYHVIETPAIHRDLTWLIDHLPPRVHLVLVSRADPPLPLGRWRARNQLHEIRAADLRFTHTETTAWLSGTMGLPLSPSAIAELDARVEGWAAGLQLAALAVRGHDDPGARIEAFSGRHQYVLAYLVDEVLARQPEYVQQFLLQTAILDRLNAALCDAVMHDAPAADAATAIPTSRFILEYLRENNLFVIALDDEGVWYRYHHLFGEMLRHRLRQVGPHSSADLHRRAAHWYAQERLIDPAIKHALAAGDHALAAQWIAQAADEPLRTGDVGTLRDWLAALPDELVRSHPQLAVARCWVMVITGHTGAMQPWLDAAAAAPTDQPRLQAEVAALRAQSALRSGDANGADAAISAGLHIVPADAYRIKGTLNLFAGNLALLRGDSAGATAAFGAASSLAEQGGEHLLLLYAGTSQADLAEIQGRLSIAVQAHQQMLRTAAGPYGPRFPTAGMALIGLGKVARERNDLEAAERHLQEGITLGRKSAISGIVIDGLITLALVRCARGDHAAAAELLAEATTLAERWHPALIVARVATFQARIDLAAGRTAAAVQWAQTVDLAAHGTGSDLGEIEQLTLVRVRLAEGRREEARALLDRLQEAAERAERHGRLIEILVLRGLLLHAAGDTDGARASVAHALALGQNEHYVRTFADEGAPLHELVAAIAAHPEAWPEQVRPDYLAAVLAAFAPAERTPDAAERPNQELIEPLSDRELEVLQLVAAGCSNQEIADRLIIAPATVRKHIENIHGKLGVRNRTQAAARARELGIV